MVNTKDNIWIEGFPAEHAFRSRMYGTKCISGKVTLIYQGKTDKIPENIAKECCEIHQGLSYWGGPNDIFYVDYNNKLNGFSKAINSVMSACPEEWCIIYRKND